LIKKAKKMKEKSMNPNQAINEASQAKKKLYNIQKKMESIKAETKESTQKVQEVVSSAKATRKKVLASYEGFSELKQKLVVTDADKARFKATRALLLEKKKHKKNPKLSSSF
jgi:hypothetical protein